ncbi:MAG: VWA domain-containing protein [bacterium]|nr:VWA domain-containing protein [bacterium]
MTIESGAGGCGSFKLSITPCVAGRCCYMRNDEALCDNTTHQMCADLLGMWSENERCETEPCPLGRCCYRVNGTIDCVENYYQKDCLFGLQGEWQEGGDCGGPCLMSDDSSACGPMDLVIAIDVTGSMTGEIAAVRTQAESILETAIEVAGSDLRASLVTFRDEVVVLHPLTTNSNAVVGALATLTANGGLELPEASAVALREIISGDGECVVGSGFTTPFRNGATRLVILITDAPNGGCDDLETPDDIEYAHQCALDAANEDIAISAVYVADGD